MNRLCKVVRDLLLDAACADSDVLEERAVVNCLDVLDGLAGRAGLHGLAIQETDLGKADIMKHLKDCPECREYADTLVNISRLLHPIDRPVTSEGAGDGTMVSTEAEVITPNWARLSVTIEQGIKMRIARERKVVSLFALAAAGILAAVWGPLLVWNPQAFLGLQAVGFFGIALFYLPIHLLSEQRGENL